MSKYPTVKLGDVCIIERGGSPRPINKFITKDPNGINWIKIGDTSADSMYITKTAEKIIPEGVLKSRQVKKGDFILSNSMSFGRPYILNIDGCIHDGWLLIRDINDIFEKQFLYYYLSSETVYANLKQMAVGGVVNNLNSNKVRSLMVPVLKKEDQVKICNKLNKITTIIQQRKQQLSKLDELAKSRFIEMFGDFPLNEKKWETGQIRNVVYDVRYGTSLPASLDGKYPYFRMNNITYSGELDLSEIKRINIPDREFSKYAIQKGDVLFNRTNSKELVGKTCVYDKDDKMILAGFIIRIRVNDRMLPEFLSAFLNADFSKKMLLEKCKTAIGQANINAQELQNFDIYIPPIELQKQFVFIKNQLDKSKFRIKKSLEKLEMTYKALLQEYFG